MRSGAPQGPRPNQDQPRNGDGAQQSRPGDSPQGQNQGGGSGRRRRRRGGGGGGSGGGGQGPRGPDQQQQQQRGPQPGRDNRGGRPQGGGRGRDGGRGQRQDHRQDNRSRDQQKQQPPLPKEPPFKHVFKRYGVVFYENFALAKADLEQLAIKAKEFDQLNIVVKAEGDMDDPDLTKIGKVFAGAAWTLIHERRVQDGWYNEPR